VTDEVDRSELTTREAIKSLNEAAEFDASRQMERPLSGVRVLDFGHTVMGPCCAMLFADLGADVIKIEPAPDGDRTRQLKGFGTGYFGNFNRNKRSLVVDLKTPSGQTVMQRLLDSSDVLIENFAPGTMERLGIGYDVLSKRHPRLIYCSLKGFMHGPYQERQALDEVVQMMSGLAYMTGPPGQPLRAGTSIVDIVGAMFGTIGILVALKERERTGRGKLVRSALFESAVFLMGQHLCYASQSKDPIPPMPARVSAWAVYDLFSMADGQKIFVGITSDKHWERFCQEFNLMRLHAQPGLQTNNLRIAARARLLPELASVIAALSPADVIERLGRANLPFARVSRPEDLFEDPHVLATGMLMETWLPNGERLRTPRLPLQIDGCDLARRENPPSLGQDTDHILNELGFGEAVISALRKEGSVA